jgi:hypothetical protein
MGNCFANLEPQPSTQSPQGKGNNDIVPSSWTPTNKPDTTTFEKRILHLHNVARAKNGLKPLVWNMALQQRAADWNLFMKQKEGENAVCRNMRHPGTGPDGSEEEVGKYLPNSNGQNLYQSNAVKFENNQFVPFDSSSPGDAVRQWYDECRMWEKPAVGQQVPNRFLEIGHMTQILWRDAQQLGCSAIECIDKNIVDGAEVASKGKIITCHYDKGNVAGQFQTQIPDNIFCESPNNWILND